MDKKSKVFLWVFFLLVVASVGVTYWRIMIKRDYVIEAQGDCDPTTQKCFVSHCDPSTDNTCTGDEEKDTSYFSKVRRNASKVPLCDPADENCKPFDCQEGERDCTVTFCDDATKSKDDECSDPDQYNADHPATDDSADLSGATCDPATDDTCTTDQSADSTDSTADTSQDGSNSDNSSQNTDSSSK